MTILARRSITAVALTLSLLALCAGRVRAQAASSNSSSSIEVYPGPGVDTYRSNLYSVEVSDGTNWIPAYVYAYSRKSVTHWHYGVSPSVHFLTFGTTGPADVRVTRLGGFISSVDVSPRSKNIPAQVAGGRVVLTLKPNNKAWVILNGDDADPLFLFADAPKPPVPAGATYFGPGIRDIAPAAANHYKARNKEVIYLDGGAWVRGNIDIRGTRNVRITGPGVLSGDLWQGETVGSSVLPFIQFTNYSMINGDWAGNAATVQGITILDSPGYNFWSGATDVSDVKILSPWFYSTDGFQNVSHVDQTFVFNGDNVFTPMWAGQQNDNVTYTSCFAGTTNNSVFAGGYWGSAAGNRYSSFADDIDIKTYASDEWTPESPLLAAAFQIWVDNDVPTKGFSNQTYQNVRIEGNLDVPLMLLKNTVYPWTGSVAPNPPLGNSYNIVFRNISLSGTQKYLSEIKGWDANNGFHDVVLENVTINGTLVTAANFGNYFRANSFVSGLTDTAPRGPCPAAGVARPARLEEEEEVLAIQPPRTSARRPQDVPFHCAH